MNSKSEEKSQEIDELSEKEVFRSTHEEIARSRQTQCEMGKHKFKKHSENEISCPLCGSIYIIDPKKMKDYV